MSESSEVRDVAALLEDEYAHAILLHTNDRAMSVERLAEVCDASPSTIYRRIERLETHDLLDERVELDPDGHHYNTYAARLNRITIELTENGFDIEIAREEPDPADRFTDLFEGLQ